MSDLDSRIIEYIDPLIESALVESEDIDPLSLAFLLSGELEEQGLIEHCSNSVIHAIALHIDSKQVDK